MPRLALGPIVTLFEAAKKLSRIAQDYPARSRHICASSSFDDCVRVY
ncbi:MAG TPA: hypothetical protein VFR78_23050 [Pyrinomonadaceae bacterium]|nr:hypothetical protein [Pyrinomonadaceae bacterium]